MTDRNVPMENTSSWAWEPGHDDNPGEAWYESTEESLWLRPYKPDGSAVRSTLGDHFIGYHSFKSCGNGVMSRVWAAGLNGAGSVHLYSLVGKNFIPSLSHTGEQSAVVDDINRYLETELERLSAL